MVTKCLPSGHHVVNMWSPSGHQVILMGPIDEMVNKNWVTSAKTSDFWTKCASQGLFLLGTHVEGRHGPDIKEFAEYAEDEKKEKYAVCAEYAKYVEYAEYAEYTK